MPHSVQRVRDLLGPGYAIDSELGRGGMATVYLAHDSKHDRVVALKVLHPELAASLGPERFLREIKVAARLNHPHILPLFDSGEAQGLLYYVMPYVKGETLRERLDRDRQLSLDEAIRVARTIALALDYAHRENVVHRDIKPENIMLYEGDPMVMDFGIAKAVSVAGETAERDSSLTQTGMMLGTPAYVSPEQAAGETELDGRSDQYSLACVLFEMLAGERPFGGASTQAVLTKRFMGPPRRIGTLRPGVPERVERALLKAMATDVWDRYETAAGFARALDAGMQDPPTENLARPQQTPPSAKSVAVLPFLHMSADPDNEYFTDGMTEEIINALTKIQSLRVASRTSSFAFKGQNEDIGDIGRRLKVSTVVEGSVRRMGRKLRITAQLVNVADGYHLWSERYDRELEDVFAIQDDISQAIVRSLSLILTEGEKKAIEKPRTVNVDAYEFYLRGRQYYHQWRVKSAEYALQMFNRAIEIDPDYARAYAGVADSHSRLYVYGRARETNFAQADSASNKALELNPDLVEGHVARGFVVSLMKRFDEANSHFETALKLDPNHYEAAYFYARALKAQGRNADAAKMFERASQLSPEDYLAPTFLCSVLADMGLKAESEAARRRALTLIEERLKLNPDDSRPTSLAMGLLARVGDREGALDYMRRSVAIDPDDAQMQYNIACAYALLGMEEEALASLETAAKKGWSYKEWIENDSDFQALRDKPRFKAIVQSM